MYYDKLLYTYINIYRYSIYIYRIRQIKIENKTTTITMMWFQYLYNTILQVTGVYFLFYDVARGIGSSNGRFTSFAQSLESAYKYKAGHYDISNKQNVKDKTICKSILKYIYRCIVSTFLKFGHGTIVSIALGLYPTWTKGPRHIYSYYIAFFVIQLLPRNIGFLFFHKNIFSRIIMFTATALYKLRKLIFILQATSHGVFIVNQLFFYGDHNEIFIATKSIVTQISVFLLALWECEGSSLSRRIELDISNSGDGYGNRCHRPFLHYMNIIFKTTYSYFINLPFFFTRCCSIVAVWMLYFSWKNENINIDIDNNIGYTMVSENVLPFRIKIYVLIILWFRYNVTEFLVIVNYCADKICCNINDNRKGRKVEKSKMQ